MKRFSELSDDELVSLSHDDLNTSIRIEAINRGIAPPIPLSEDIARQQAISYQFRDGATRVYRLAASYHRSQFGYLNENDAKSAMCGAVLLDESGYPRTITKISSEQITLDSIWIGGVTSTKTSSVEPADTSESEAFIAVVDECMQRHRSVCQDRYDRRVNIEKRAEYLRLADGNETVARAFWAKVESAQWPEVTAETAA